MNELQVMGSIANTIASDQINAWHTNPWMIPAAIVAIAVGYIYYVFQTIILLKEHKSLGPIWMHCFFAADDTTAAVVFFLAARKYDNFWFYWLFCIGMFIWVAFEIFCVRMALKYEQKDFIRGVKDPKQMAVVALMVYAVSLCIINLIRNWTGDEVMLMNFTLCNILAVTIPPLFGLRRETRTKYEMGFYTNSVLIAFTNFLPANFGWWTTASPFFDHYWWYLSGLIMTAYTIWAWVTVYKKPKDDSWERSAAKKAAKKAAKAA